MVRAFLLALLLARITGTAIAGGQLILVSGNPYISEGEPVVLDAYLYNSGKKSISCPPLRFISAKWSLSDPSGQRLARGGESALVADHGTPHVTISARAVLHERITLNIKAEPGDLVKVDASLEGVALRSNSVLLYCPIEGAAAQPASSPKSAITPQKISAAMLR